MKVLFSRQDIPANMGPSIALLGPTPRYKTIRSWRQDAVAFLKYMRFEGTVLVPENKDFTFRDWEGDFPYDEQVEWEHQMCERADVLMFWIPRNMETLPGLTTNCEFGTWMRSGRVILGAPPEAVHVRYQQWWAKKLGIPTYNRLQDTCWGALTKLGIVGSSAV